MIRLRVGVIGAGIVGSAHAAVYEGIAGAELIAVADIDESKARRLANKHGAKPYADYLRMLKDETIDAVSVCTPDFAHRDPTVAALEAGKHVLVEKPLSTGVDDAEDILNASRKAGVKLMVNFSNRWNPPFLRAKEALDGSKLGDLLYLYVRLNDTIFVPTKMLSWAGKSAVSFFLMSHTADLARWYAKSEAKRVFATSRKRVLARMGIDTPDFYAATVEFDNGVVANLESLWVLPTSHPSVYDFKMEMVGSKGSVFVDTTDRCVDVYEEDQHSRPDTLGLVDLYGVQAGFVKESIAAFVDSVLSDKPVPVTGEDGLSVVRILEAVDKSCTQGQPVDLG